MKRNKLTQKALAITIISGLASTAVLADVKVRLKTGNDFVVGERDTGTDNLVVNVDGGVDIPRGELTFNAVGDSAGVITSTETLDANDTSDTALVTAKAISDGIDAKITAAAGTTTTAELTNATGAGIGYSAKKIRKANGVCFTEFYFNIGSAQGIVNFGVFPAGYNPIASAWSLGSAVTCQNQGNSGHMYLNGGAGGLKIYNATVGNYCNVAVAYACN